MTSKYLKSIISNIYDFADRYKFLKDELTYTFKFFATLYDLKLSEFEFLIDSIHFEMEDFSNSQEDTGFFDKKEAKDNLETLKFKGFIDIYNQEESEDCYHYYYSHTEKAKKLAKDFDARLSSLLDKNGSGKDLLDFAYKDAVNNLNPLLDALRVLASDDYLLNTNNDENFDPEYSRRFDLLCQIKKVLNKKYQNLSILRFDEYREIDDDYEDEDDLAYLLDDLTDDDNLAYVVDGFNKDERHSLLIEYTDQDKIVKRFILVDINNYEDIIEGDEIDSIEDGEAFTHFVMLMDDLNRNHKKIKEKLRNLYEFIAPAYDLSLAEFEFCLYYTTIYTSADEEIYDIDGYFIDDSEKIVNSLIKKGYIYEDEDGFTLTEKSDAVFKHMGALFANTMEKNEADYDKLLTFVNNYYDASETLDEFTDNFVYRFSFEDFDIKEKLSDEIDEYSLGVPFDKAVCALIGKKFTNPKVLHLTDKGDYIEAVFTTDDYKDQTLAAYLNKNGINEIVEDEWKKYLNMHL